MKAFRHICIAVISVFLIVAVIVNIALIKNKNSAEGEYRVEASRLADDIEKNGTYDLSEYPRLTGVYTSADGPLYESENNYLIIEARGELYRVEYKQFTQDDSLVLINCILAALFLLILGFLIYIRTKIIVPFGRLDSVPRELAKGNLAVEIPEEKSRFFGRFTWGINMLRENLEGSRKQELQLLREKKLLLLSLSHDIKTPLSAIKLNAKALARGLYQDEDKRRAAAESINKRADEIENFVTDITRAASEDFMNFEVNIGEVFLSEIISKINARYAAQLELSGTNFKIGEYGDCLLSCDGDRLGECLQNLIENAIKYGDGTRISISFDKMDGCELIMVSNPGCTLENKELVQIFDSFQRGSNAQGAGGNGLGLFICKRLMTLMNGDVYAEIKDGEFRITLVVRLA